MDDEDEWESQPPGRHFPYDGWDKPSPARKPGKTYSPHYKGDNSGGYGNPPVSGQRKTGEPGGPGRPKGHTSLRAALQRAFRRKLPIVRNGKVAKLHLSDILAERIVEAILGKNPSPSMIELARRLMEQYGPQMPDQEPLQGNIDGFSEDELGIVSGLFARCLGEPPGETRRHVLGTVDEPFPQGEFRIFRRDDGHIGVARIGSDGEVSSNLGTD